MVSANGQLEYSNPPLTLYGPGIVRFEGVGPTASLNAERKLGNSGFSLFGNVRGSVLIGDIRTASLLLNIPTGSIEDEVMTIFENQLGVAWNYDLTKQLELEVRTAWETQYWANSTLEDDFYGIGTNLALMGPTVAVELALLRLILAPAKVGFRGARWFVWSRGRPRPRVRKNIRTDAEAKAFRSRGARASRPL